MFNFVINEKFFSYWISKRIYLFIDDNKIPFYVEMNMLIKIYEAELDLGANYLHFIS